MNPSGVARSMKRSQLLVRVCAGAMLLASTQLSACYKFSGGGGFPPGLKTVAITPFDNLSPSPEVQGELNEFMRKSFHDRLNLRDAPEEKADVLVHGTIGKYEADIATGISADSRQVSVSTRSLQLVVNVEITDTKSGKILYRQVGLTGNGQYAEGHEADGRKLAVAEIVDKMIQGTQSQW